MRRTRSTLLGGIAVVGLLALSVPSRADEPRNGGSLTIAFKDDVATLDPAIGYDWQNWALIKSVFNTLMDYEPGTTKLRPMLAESYTVSQDGLTYTFKLRPGVTFHNGRVLTADDLVYSLERTVNPKTQSPGQSFFAVIAGFDDFTHGKSEHLGGVRAVDPGTLEIKLSQPSAPFLHVMALNFGAAVPKEEVERAGGDFGKHPVGTGAFVFKDWQLGQRIVLERNPAFFEKGIPHLDQLVVEVGQEPLTALLRLQNGQVDALGDGIPPAKFNEVMRDPTLKKDVVTGPRIATTYVAMKVTQKPFDDLRVRQAVGHAIDKARIVKLINGRAVPANQVLPPGMPGYEDSYQGLGHDPEKAKALLKEAGYADGFSTTLYANNTDPNPRIAQAIQQDLTAVGIKADLKTLAQENVIAAAGTPDQAPMTWSGGMAWSQDYPDPSDFYTPILSCSSAVQGGWNWSFYCRKDLDEKAAQADALADPAKMDERLGLWRDIYRQVMADAPWVPIYNEKYYTMRAPRIGGPDALFVDPIYTPINYAYIWATDGK
jgi:ABC-type transport system substrate-binding protein